jgi:hypothetical protein
MARVLLNSTSTFTSGQRVLIRAYSLLQRAADRQVMVRSSARRLVGLPMLFVFAGALSVAASASAQDLGRYRDVPLGAPLHVVKAATRTADTAVSIVHARPRLIQELRWRPRYMTGGSGANEAVREVAFRFLDDQLFSIVVWYDAYAVEGLTGADMIAVLGESYGPPTGRKTGTLASWERDDVTLTLTTGAYPSPFQLTFLSARLAEAARVVGREADRLDRIEAPARQAALEAEAARDRAREAAATRSKNKGVFRP